MFRELIHESSTKVSNVVGLPSLALSSDIVFLNTFYTVLRARVPDHCQSFVLYTFKQVMGITLFARIILDSLIWVSNIATYLRTLANVQFATQIYIVFVLAAALACTPARSIISTKLNMQKFML